MKNLFLIVLICLTSSFANSQDLNCKDFHIGKFEMDSEFGKIYITRSKTTQIEYCKEVNYKATYNIVWKNDCTYELSGEEIQSGEEIDPNKNIRVISEIYKIEKQFSFLKVSSNISDEILDLKLKKIN